MFLLKIYYSIFDVYYTDYISFIALFNNKNTNLFLTAIRILNEVKDNSFYIKGNVYKQI
jgi:hypothetical protein